MTDDMEKIDHGLRIFRNQERRRLEAIKPFLFAEIHIPNYSHHDRQEYGSSVRYQIRCEMARLIEEATIDGRMYLIKRWRGEHETMIGSIPHVAIREYALITLPDVRQVNKIGDVVLSDEFTRTANGVSSDAVVFVPLDFLPVGLWTDDPPMHQKVKIAEMRRTTLRLPATDERLIVWECIGIQGG